MVCIRVFSEQQGLSNHLSGLASPFRNISLESLPKGYEKEIQTLVASVRLLHQVTCWNEKKKNSQWTKRWTGISLPPRLKAPASLTWAGFVPCLAPSVALRWSEPSSSSQSTESCRCAAWKKSTACPTISGIGSWLTRGAARSASASTSPTDTRTTARTECSTPCTAWTTAWAGAANSGERKSHRHPSLAEMMAILLLFRLGQMMFCGCQGQLGLLWRPKHT